MKIGRSKRIRMGVVLVGLTALLAGCMPPPKLDLDDYSTGQKGSAAKAPTVQRLIDHIDCEMWDAYNRNKTTDQNNKHGQLWNHLVENEFIVSIDLQVMVTNSQSFAPSETWSSPTDYKGGHVHINKPLPESATSPNVSQPSSSYSQSLALSEQFNSSQDRNFEFQYSQNFADIVEYITEQKGKDFCDSVDKQGSPLEGKLRLEETIDSGLLGIDRANNSLGARNDVTEPPQPSATWPNGGHAISYLAKSGSGAGAQAGSAKSGSVSQSNQFSSKIDFSLISGGGASVNGNTLWFKLGNGGGGAGSGSSGGGGQQMLNMSKTSLDTLSITFAANCKKESRQKEETVREATPPPAHLLLRVKPEASSDKSDGGDSNKMTPPLTLTFVDATVVIDPFDVNDAQEVQAIKGFVFKNGHYALLQGYAFKIGRAIDIEGAVGSSQGASAGGGADASSSDAKVSFKMALTIDEGGSIELAPATLSGPVDSVVGLEHLDPKDYWASLPACTDDHDSMLAKSGQNQNLLMKLPQALRFTQ